jgi:hypothetical protein
VRETFAERARKKAQTRLRERPESDGKFWPWRRSPVATEVQSMGVAPRKGRIEQEMKGEISLKNAGEIKALKVKEGRPHMK